MHGLRLRRIFKHQVLELCCHTQAVFVGTLPKVATEERASNSGLQRQAGFVEEFLVYDLATSGEQDQGHGCRAHHLVHRFRPAKG